MKAVLVILIPRRGHNIKGDLKSVRYNEWLWSGSNSELLEMRQRSSVSKKSVDFLDELGHYASFKRASAPCSYCSSFYFFTFLCLHYLFLSFILFSFSLFCVVQETETAQDLLCACSLNFAVINQLLVSPTPGLQIGRSTGEEWITGQDVSMSQM